MFLGLAGPCVTLAGDFSPLPAHREAGGGAAPVHHAPHRAAIHLGRAEGGQRGLHAAAAPKARLPPVPRGACPAQEHQRPEIGLQRALPQPHLTAELSGTTCGERLFHTAPPANASVLCASLSCLTWVFLYFFLFALKDRYLAKSTVF